MPAASLLFLLRRFRGLEAGLVALSRAGAAQPLQVPSLARARNNMAPKKKRTVPREAPPAEPEARRPVWATVPETAWLKLVLLLQAVRLRRLPCRHIQDFCFAQMVNCPEGANGHSKLVIIAGQHAVQQCA